MFIIPVFKKIKAWMVMIEIFSHCMSAIEFLTENVSTACAAKNEKD